MSTRGYVNFLRPYPNGWQDGESGNTPVCASVLNGAYDAYLETLNGWAVAVNTDLDAVVNVEANPEDAATESLLKLKIGSTIYGVSGGSGGSSVSWNQIQATGTKIAEITIDNVTSNVYVPVDTGDTVIWSEIQNTGTKIATININGTETDVYAPSGSGGASALTDLSDVAISSPSNGQILTYNNSTSKWGNSDIPLPYKEVTGTLSSGNTSITLSDASITTSSTIDIYTDGDVDYNSVSVSTGSVTITFDAQSSNLGVKVRVS